MQPGVVFLVVFSVVFFTYLLPFSRFIARRHKKEEKGLKCADDFSIYKQGL